METDELTKATVAETAACKRVGSKLSKKSYKDTCKFTINSLLSKPDRPHKTPAPHVNCKITNKKAHAVFSFNDSPEKLIKIKSPHMLTAEVKKLYSPPNLIEGYRYHSSGSREGLNLSKEGKYKPSCTSGIYNSRPSSTTVSSTFRPTTAQLLYQRQLSKQEHRTKDRPESGSESAPDTDHDPFKFTSSSCSNGHSPTFKLQSSAASSYPPEFDKFAYHSPEHNSFEMEGKLSGESKYNLTDKAKMELCEMKTELPSDIHDTKYELLPLHLTKPAQAHEVKTETLCLTKPELQPLKQSPVQKSYPSTPPESSSSSDASTRSPKTEPETESCDAAKTSEEQQPSSKLYRGKLSFFKQAISQEIHTIQESEKKALAAKKESEKVEEEPVLELTPPESKKAIEPPIRSPTKPKELPTNVIRKVVKRPLPSPISSQMLVTPKTTFTTVPLKKPGHKVVHSINANPIPLVMNGHKVNVVKIEKHHMANTQMNNKDMSVFKFTNDQSSHNNNPYPIHISDYVKVQPSRKRKISSEGVKGCDLKTKKVSKTVMSPNHQVTFSTTPYTSPTKHNGTPTEIVKVEHSVLNKQTMLHTGGVKTNLPLKSRKSSGQSKKSLQHKLLVHHTDCKVMKTQAFPNVKLEPKTEQLEPVKPVLTTPIKSEPRDHLQHDVTKQVTNGNEAPIKSVAIPTPPTSLLSDPRSYLQIEACPDGGATYVRLDMDVFDNLSNHQQSLLVDYFFEVTFGETEGVADHVMGIISRGSRDMPNVLNHIVKSAPGLKVKQQVLGKKDVLNCTIADYYDKIKSNRSRCLFHEGGLQHVSLVGTKSEESGAMFPELIHLMEANPFFELTLPWGELTQYQGLDPGISNDGPIFWVRPGEQFLQATSGSRNHKGYRLLKNRETLIEDRTRPHADHSWEDGNIMTTTAAAAFLQPIEYGDNPQDQVHSLKDVIAFDASNFYQLAEELQLDLYEPPMTQCDTWIEDAKLNQLRELNIKYAKIRLKPHDIYFIPRNVIHQFKTVAACLSVAWHVRLRQYYDNN